MHRRDSHATYNSIERNERNFSRPINHRQRKPRIQERTIISIIIVALVLGTFAIFAFQYVENKTHQPHMIFHGYVPLHPDHRTSLILSALPDHTQDLPDRWVWTDVDGVDYTTSNHNQHQPYQYCGACWVFGSLAVIDDRLRIQNPNGRPFESAHQAMINCGPHYEAGCNGGMANEAYRWIYENGIPDTTCINYQAKNMACDDLGLCQDCMPLWGQPPGTCAGKKEGTYPIAIVEEYGPISIEPKYQRDQAHIDEQVKKMKAEIKERGPIGCAIDATAVEYYAPWHPFGEDDLPYEAYVFTAENAGNACDKGDGYPDDCLDHQIEVVGWDKTDEGLEYWLIRNSWGLWWGENGWFRIEVGKNVMGIESDCEWVIPRVLSDFEEIQEFLAQKEMRKAVHAKKVAQAARAKRLARRKPAKRMF